MKLLLYHYLSSEDMWMMNTTKSILGRLSSFSTGNGRVFASLLHEKKQARCLKLRFHCSFVNWGVLLKKKSSSLIILI